MSSINKSVICVAFAFIIFLSAVNPSFAQNNSFRRISDAEINRFMDHTFWKIHKLDRIYFNSDGTFIQQLNDDWDGVENGSMYTGTWEAKNSELCWTYDAQTAEKYATTTNPFCYTVLTNSPADSYMTTHMESFRLYSTEPGQLGTIAFEWNRYAYDNYVLDPEYIETVQNGLKQMATYRRAGNIPSSTIRKEKLTDPWMQNYYDETVNRIFFIADQSMFFNDKGLYFFINENGINKSNGDIENMLSNGSKGRWQMKDNIHCWFLSGNRSSCEFIMPKGKGLIRPYDGIFGVFYTGFTRVHGEMATGHIDPNDTSAPELFNSLLNVAP